jgi:Flp pilus assembly protein TadD
MPIHFKRISFRRRELLALAAVLSLGACQSFGDGMGGKDAREARKMTREAKIDAALERAALQGAQKGKSMATLTSLEQAYKKDNDDPEKVIAYASGLREADYLNRALIVLAPIAGEDDAPSRIVSEYAAVNLGMGNYAEAEDFARKAIITNADNHQAFHILGIALDAMGHHKQAEVAFRKGLDLWHGDPTPIMNNLALNLASQGMLDESSEILHRAAAAAPNRPEIERNLRIVAALQKSVKRLAPSGGKPDMMVLPAKKPEREG